jgi:prevent-host-death family protein
MAVKVVGTRQLREELAPLLAGLSEVEEIIVTQRGEGKAVLLEIERYNQLRDRVEYLEDSLDAVEAERDGAVSLAELG